MKLYHITYDSVSYWVEAPDFRGAIAAWREHVKVEWGKDYSPFDEPESVHLVHEEPVLRLVKASAIPPGHICLFLDGDNWVAVNPDFRNLQESPSGVAEEPGDAIVALHAAEDRAAMAEASAAGKGGAA